MAYIQQRGERKYKITVCNGYTTTGKKRMQARTIDVPKEIPKRSIRQYVYAEAERLEKRFRTGIDESENTKFEAYAEHWLDRAAKRYKASTLAGYRKMLEVAYPYIGGLPLCKIRPMVLEEFAEELRKRPGRGGKPLSENTVHKYLDAVSAVLQDAAKNDILLYNPAHRVEKVRVEKPQQRIPQQWEMRKLLQCILQEPLLYRVYYLMALSTGLRRGELCALRWCDLHGGNQVKIQHSRSTVVGQGVLESDTKNHRARIVVMPQIVFDELGELFTEQALENNGADWNGLIFQRKASRYTPILSATICGGCTIKTDSLRNTTCTPYGISSPPICWNTVPASRWRPTCWGTQIPPFWNEPTAIRRISAKRRLPGCLILCWHRQRKNTVPPWMNEIPMLLFIRHTHSEDFLFWENPHY